MDSDDDIFIVKVTAAKQKAQKKASSWVTSSFDDFGPTSSPVFSGSSSAATRPTKTQSCSQTLVSQPRKTVQKKISSSLVSDKSDLVSRKRQRELSLPAHKLMSAVKSGGHRKLKSASSFDLWSEKHHPKRREDLAVHKKKVEDICGWLRDKTQRCKKRAAPMLLLTGAPGTGKTATVRTLATELRLTVQEWANPNTAGGDNDFRAMETKDWAERSSVDVFSSQSQSSQFSQFVLRANKYQALQLDSVVQSDADTQGTLILVEDIPNSFYRDPSELHNILRKYGRCGQCPLVFVVSDTSNSSSNVQRLFPPALLEELHIDTISVNPVAPTMMVKVLNKIANTEAAQGEFTVPSARVVESIAMSSAGDVRSAINALQFACRQDTLDLSKLRGVQKTLKKEGPGSGRRLKYGSLAKQDSGATTTAAQEEGIIGVKDTTCFLFHALGKILYFKRGDPTEVGEQPTLPHYLQQHHRDPLLLTPEEVVEKTHLSGDYFNSFLHQNYLHFLQDTHHADRAAHYLSDADILSAQYSSRGQLQDYSVSVATRGFIHSDSSISCHTDARKGHGWRPLHKSQWFSVQRQSQENKTSAMHLFRGYHWDPEVLLTEIVPYINLTNPTLHDPGQISFVQNLCQFSRSSYGSRCGLEKIEEKAAMDDDSPESDTQTDRPSSSLTSDPRLSLTEGATSQQQDRGGGDDDILPSSQSTVKAAPVEMEDDDFVIEEFDD